MQRTQHTANPLLLLLQRRDGRRSSRTAAAGSARRERAIISDSPCPRSPRHRTEHPQWPQLVTTQYVFVVVNVPSC
jgi:hypothetical protein